MKTKKTLLQHGHPWKPSQEAILVELTCILCYQPKTSQTTTIRANDSASIMNENLATKTTRFGQNPLRTKAFTAAESAKQLLVSTATESNLRHSRVVAQPCKRMAKAESEHSPTERNSMLVNVFNDPERNIQSFCSIYRYFSKDHRPQTSQ